MNRKFVLSILALTLSGMAIAGVKVTSVDLNTNGSTGYISIKLDGRSNELPDLRVYGNVIELSLNKSDSFPGISKTVRGAYLSANALNGKAVIKTILPYAINAEAVNVGWKNSSIEVSFPRGAATAAFAPKLNTADRVAQDRVAYEGAGVSTKEKSPQPAAVAAPEKKSENTVAYEGAGIGIKEKKPDSAKPKSDTMENKISKDILNEDYLNKLMKEDTGAKKDVETANAENGTLKNDTVSSKQAAPAVTNAPITVNGAKPQENNGGKDYSFAGYAAKFTIFLAVVLGLFYGIVQLLKKGVFSRGKLGFLNNSQMIQVLSTTYIAPKRSLMVVKAHKQIFLVGNSESGMTFLSEMTDTAGLIKDGEKVVTGTNFDEKLDQAEMLKGYDAFIKVKENIMESTPINEEPKGLAKLASAKDDIVKFSDELKKKAKKLKPIEFN